MSISRPLHGVSGANWDGRVHVPVALAGAVLLDLEGVLVDGAALGEVLGDLVLLERRLGLGVVVGDVVVLVGAGHDGWVRESRWRDGDGVDGEMSLERCG